MGRICGSLKSKSSRWRTMPIHASQNQSLFAGSRVTTYIDSDESDCQQISLPLSICFLNELEHRIKIVSKCYLNVYKNLTTNPPRGLGFGVWGLGFGVW